jgi:hypothetical protein
MANVPAAVTAELTVERRENRMRCLTLERSFWAQDAVWG